MFPCEWLLPESTFYKGGVISYPPTHPSYTPNTHTRALSFPLLLHNGFTRRWPCSNEVWSFCDATGKLPCGTVLSILVHHIEFLTDQIYKLKYLAHSVLSTDKIQTYFHQTPLNNCETRLISWCTLVFCPFALIVVSSWTKTYRICVPTLYYVLILILKTIK